MATAILDPDAVRNALGLQRLPQPALAPDPSMSSVAPALPPPTSPNVSLRPPTSQDITGSRLLSNQTELKRLQDTGSGISQIQNPLLRGLARVGDTAERIILPGAEAVTPGTEGNNQRLTNIQQGRVNSDLTNQQQQATTGQTEANTAYLAARPDIEQSKIDQKQTAVQERVGQAAAAKGQLVSWDENGIPTFTDDHTSQAFADHQALSAMHQATADKSAIMADISKNHYIPGTPEFDEAQRKLAQVDKRMQVAMAGLGLRSQSLDLRRQNTNAALYGTDNAGNALPGAAQITGDDGTGTTVGSKFAPTAIKANAKTATFNDLTGSVSHLRNAIKAYEAEGGDMSDPRLAAAAADPHSTVGKVIQGKLVTGGLSPTAITLLNAQRQTEEQAGILRSTTGGTSSEAGAQRILAVVPHFGSDTNQSAYSKLDEQENVLKRLTPGQTHVQGGVSVSHPGGATYSHTATGPGGHKIGSNDGVTWFDTQTGKAVQ
jgi:hypothetical protein